MHDCPLFELRFLRFLIITHISNVTNTLIREKLLIFINTLILTTVIHTLETQNTLIGVTFVTLIINSLLA